MREQTYKEKIDAKRREAPTTVPDGCPDEGLYWWTHPDETDDDGELVPFIGFLWHGDPPFIVCLGEDTTDYHWTPEHDVVSKVLWPDEVDLIERIAEKVDNLEGSVRLLRELEEAKAGRRAKVPKQATWLRREGDHLVVLVEDDDGDWVEVIREHDAGPGESFTSHIVEAGGVRRVRVDAEGGEDGGGAGA